MLSSWGTRNNTFSVGDRFGFWVWHWECVPEGTLAKEWTASVPNPEPPIVTLRSRREASAAVMNLCSRAAVKQ